MIALILLIIAAVLFGIAALGYEHVKVNLIALGLCIATVALITERI